MKSFIFVLWCIAVLAGSGPRSLAQANPDAHPSTAQAVPILDGGAGPCAVEFTVTSSDGKPAAGAKVKVHIAYRFGGFHKLDLDAGTNSDGKVRFTGLPARVRRSELQFEATKDQMVGTASLDPAKECQATREIKLAEQTQK